MNSFRFLCAMMIAIAFTISMSSSAIAEDATGIMMVVKGDIKVTSKDGKTEAAKVGKKVSQGDTIVAGADARAKIVMSDKNVINVSPDSKIVIEKYENAGDKKNVELNVVYGKVRAAVEQKYDGEKSKFNIKTPSAVAGVRGTDFMMGYNAGTKVSQVVTFSGSVAVGTPGPGGSIRNPVFVQPGQMTEAGAGGASAPKAVPQDELNKMNGDSRGPASEGGATAGAPPPPPPPPPANVNEGDKKPLVLQGPPKPPPIPLAPPRTGGKSRVSVEIRPQ